MNLSVRRRQAQVTRSLIDLGHGELYQNVQEGQQILFLGALVECYWHSV